MSVCCLECKLANKLAKRVNANESKKYAKTLLVYLTNTTYLLERNLSQT